MCTVVLKIRKNVQTDSEVLTKLRIVQNLLCFTCFYQTYTVNVFTVLAFRDLGVFTHQRFALHYSFADPLLLVML